MRKTILNIFIVFIAERYLRTACAQNVQCQKVDFNRPTSVVNEFAECAGVAPPNILKINSYAATIITPFRPTSEFHLSAIDGLSCLLSTSIFTLDTFSEIRTAIFLSFDAVGAWVKVQIFDNDGEEIDVIADLEESNGWTAFSVKVNRTIENAQIEISTNINANSMMAMEYLFVLNSELPNDACVDEESNPIITDPTDETSDTDLPTEPTITDPTDDPVPTDEPTDDPSIDPTDDPFPTDDPSIDPTDDPFPTDEPTDDPSIDPTDDPFPTDEPTDDPSIDPTEPTDEPTDSPTEPSTTVSTDEPLPTDETTDETDDDSSTIPTTTTIAPRNTRSATNVWMGLSISFFTTTIIILAGLCYFVWLYRRLTASMKSVKTSEDVSLPRLQVRNGVIDGDSVIVGVDKL